ncbi:MAG: serine hydrolase [Candidatus Marinimicrobia bacterium]|nr:serine hydrolase [Candidatus Neomarinimicrobiota bacterium]
MKHLMSDISFVHSSGKQRLVNRRFALSASLLCTAVAGLPQSFLARSVYASLASPSIGGFSVEGLGRLAIAMQGAVDRGAVDGLLTLLFRRGVVAHLGRYGWQNKSANIPMTREAIFWIASMTKPITSVAALILVDEHKMKLTDPVDPWLPELARPFLLQDSSDPNSRKPSPHPIRIVDLLTHRSGVSTVGVAAALSGANNYADQSIDSWISEVGKLPLDNIPGSTFAYGNSFDILGVLIERAAGMPFADFLRTRIFEPLHMSDTSFFVPKDKRSRLAVGSNNDVREAPMSMPNVIHAAGGLYSTADDYLKFARMLLGRGRLEETRIISHRSLDYMTSNYLTPEQRQQSFLGIKEFWRGEGFGLGVAVKDDLTINSPVMGVGSPGTFGWPGVSGVWWAVDPREDMIQIFMVQGGENEAPRRAFQERAYQAIAD